MFVIEIIVISIYAALLTFILCYSLIQANLLVKYTRFHKNRKNNLEKAPAFLAGKLPFVTVQLPVYNEKYVVNRLIDAVAAFDYPKDKFEIQVLDDSTDETKAIIAEKVCKLKKDQVDISHVRRNSREGFKAGALQMGTAIAKGELIAIFDADFVPSEDFLIKTVPAFEDENLGVVQTRWEHLNRDYSLLTKLQAFGLDAHFSVEQTGRNAGGHFINFNGTAGVWRKKCIEDAGGWQADTLTEDLDLSYRAQMKGWEFKFAEEIGSPAELPAAINALKTQQFRWTKGAAECARKNLMKVFFAKKIGLGTKVHALFHLMNSFLFVCILGTAFLSIPLILIKNDLSNMQWVFNAGAIYLVSLFILIAFYWTSFSNVYGKNIRSFGSFLVHFPLFLSVSMGLSLHNAIAVIEGYSGKKTAFIRTPKFNIVHAGDNWKGNNYLISSINLLTVLEGLLAIYFSMGIYLAWLYNDYGLLPFHLMLTFGFGFVSYYSFVHSKGSARKSMDKKVEMQPV